jgi:hypothetical protein
MIDYPEPEPEVYQYQCTVVQIDLLQYLLVWFGAGIGYFILGGQCGFCFLKDSRRNDEIIVAQSVNS